MSSETVERKEAFIGLIAPIGVDLNAVIEALSQALRTISYDTNSVRLTSFLTENPECFTLDHSDDFDRYTKFIRAGDEACAAAQRNDFFALYGIGKLNDQYKDRRTSLPTQVVHIFRQIKRTEEIETFREAYGSNIVFIACHASRRSRVTNLVSKILSSTRGHGASKLESMALQIMDIDENEKANPHGQRVVDCFQHADYVLDCTSHATLTASATRFVEAFFGHPFISPTADEYCSYMAKAASLRSTDLSRQVGAAIFGANCEVISLGCNEVPKAGGGTYWGGGEHDFRDFRLGVDSNQKVKADMLRDLLVRLQEEDWLVDGLKKMKPDDLVAKAISKNDEVGPLANAMINDVIEYGRMLHAEMNAITDAARFRRSTTNASLYCTTMPCHLCTKLIVAAGIKRVVFIEPYNKSLVGELYEDSVSMSEDRSDVIPFEQLKGITPAGFKAVFSKGRRKNADGTAAKWERTLASPIFVTAISYYVQIEPQFIDYLQKAVRKILDRPPAHPIANDDADAPGGAGVAG